MVCEVYGSRSYVPGAPLWAPFTTGERISGRAPATPWPTRRATACRCRTSRTVASRSSAAFPPTSPSPAPPRSRPGNALALTTSTHDDATVLAQEYRAWFTLLLRHLREAQRWTTGLCTADSKPTAKAARGGGAPQRGPKQILPAHSGRPGPISPPCMTAAACSDTDGHGEIMCSVHVIPDNCVHATVHSLPKRNSLKIEIAAIQVGNWEAGENAMSKSVRQGV